MKQKLSKAAKQASLKLITEMRKNDKTLVAPKKVRRTKKTKTVVKKVSPVVPLKQLDYPGRFFIKLNLDKKTQPIIPFMNNFRKGIRVSEITDVLLMTCDSLTPKTHEGLGIFVNSKKSVSEVAKLCSELGIKLLKTKHFQLSTLIPRLIAAGK